MGKKSGGSAPAPDPNIGAAALKEAQLGEEWLSFAKQQFGTENDRQKGVDALAQRVADSQLASSAQAEKWATEDRERYQSVFQPAQDRFIAEANNWDSPERQEKVATEARADVLIANQIANDGRRRQMASMGIRPDSGRFSGIEREADMMGALAVAGAGNTARENVRRQGIALRADAVNMGNGLPSSAASSMQIGIGAGSSAIGTTTAAAANARANIGIMQGGFQGAMNGYGQQAGILQGQYDSQLRAWTTQQQANASATAGVFGGLGSMAGLGVVAF